MRTKFLCISVLRVASGPRVKLASCKSALNPFLSPSPARDLCLTLCHFVLVFFSPFSIAITSLGEERANLSAFYVCSFCTCLDLSVSSSSWCLGRTAVCDCGTPWTFLLPFLQAYCEIQTLLLTHVHLSMTCFKTTQAIIYTIQTQKEKKKT